MRLPRRQDPIVDEASVEFGGWMHVTQSDAGKK
jgi:hypothetical protein